MEIRAVIEYNADGYLIYAENYTGAFVRGRTKQEAFAKFHKEIIQYQEWLGEHNEDSECNIITIQEKESALRVCDADSDIIFNSECLSLTQAQYDGLKRLALKSATDFQLLYDSIPDKSGTVLVPRKTFYGDAPITSADMYTHTKNVNSYYFAEIGIDAANEPDIVSCRKSGFDKVESADDFLDNQVFDGSYDEKWSLHKVLRRFIWHDRIHAKAMYRMAASLCGENNIANPFRFRL